MASRNVSTDRRRAAQGDERGERETIGIAIDLADCVVGMSPAHPPASFPPPSSIGALMVVDPSGSNHHLAGERDRKVSLLLSSIMAE